MNLNNDLFVGASSHIYSYSCIILILILMFIITMQLFLSRRKKAYLSLTVSLAIIICQYLILIIYEIRNTELGTAEYLGQVLFVFAFVLINLGIYQLYNTTHTREYTIAIGILIGCFIITGIRYFNVMTADELTDSFLLFHNIWIDLYLLLLTFLGYYLIARHIGQRIKYQIALTIHAITLIARLINDYVLDQEVTWMNIIQHFFPIAFYMILFVIIFNRVVELLQAIYNSAIRDGLTGLYNRPYFYNRVAEYINQGVKISVIFCDIDNFKKLNDTKGHQMGDRALRHVASILLEESEDIGIAGRYGGEELVMLLTDTSLRVEAVAEKLRSRIEAETGVTVSVGFSKHKRGLSPRDLIEQADQAMYQSKRSGKNKVTGFPPSV